MTEPYPTAINDFRSAVADFWGPTFSLTIFGLTSTVDRYAWIKGPRYQIVLHVGTQSWREIFTQVWHGLRPPTDKGLFSTEPIWYDLSSAMLTALQNAGFDADLPTTFVGHSKGGAICWLAARRMIFANGARSIDVLTFACPKVGDTRAVQNDGLRVTRHVIQRQDAIPLLPPNSPIIADCQ